MRFVICFCVILVASFAAAQPESKIATFSQGNFDQEVLESSQPVLVVFVSTLSPEGEKMAPVIKELAEQYAGRVGRPVEHRPE